MTKEQLEAIREKVLSSERAQEMKERRGRSESALFSRPMHYDREGRPIEMWQWCMLVESFDYKVIEKSQLPDGTEVSTVWLGLDHGFGGGPPLIFESMTFPPPGSEAKQDQDRYVTEEEARAGHAAMVAKWSPRH